MSEPEAGMTDDQINWLVDMATMAESLAAALGTSVSVAMRTMLLAQRVQLKHIRKNGSPNPVSLATMPTKGEPS